MTTSSKTDSQHLLRAAGGRCQCTGECGHNHRWSAGEITLRCGAPHGCNIQRKLGHPSCWRLAGTDERPLQYAELYDEQIMFVELVPVGEKVYCGFCRRRLPK
jgi:hypothetical protein